MIEPEQPHEYDNIQSVASPSTSSSVSTYGGDGDDIDGLDREKNHRRALIARNYRHRKKRVLENTELVIKNLEAENSKISDKISKLDNALYIMKFQVCDQYFKNMVQIDMQRRLFDHLEQQALINQMAKLNQNRCHEENQHEEGEMHNDTALRLCGLPAHGQLQYLRTQ